MTPSTRARSPAYRGDARAITDRSSLESGKEAVCQTTVGPPMADGATLGSLPAAAAAVHSSTNPRSSALKIMAPGRRADRRAVRATDRLYE